MRAAAIGTAAPGATYLDQSAGALRLQLHAGALDRRALPVLCRAELRTSEWRLSAHIIGASHWLRFEARADAGTPALHEVFACARLGAQRPLGRARVGESLERSVPGAGGAWRYRFESLVLDARRGRDALEGLETRVQRTPGTATAHDDLALVHRFPVDRSAVSSALGGPRTLVAAARAERAIVVDSAHVYPNEDRVVLSRTSLSPLQPAAKAADR